MPEFLPDSPVKPTPSPFHPHTFQPLQQTEPEPTDNTLLQSKSWDFFPGSYPSCVQNETAGPWITTCSLTLGVPLSASSSLAGGDSTEEEAPRGSAALSLQTGPTMAQKEEQTQDNPCAALLSQRQPAPRRQDSQNNAAATIAILH